MEKELTLAHARALWASDDELVKAIALNYYTEERLEKVALPTSWDELSSEQKRTTKEDNDALHALAKVKDLLNLYNGDWVPDWAGSHGTKYCLIAFSGEIITSNNSDHACALSFKGPENRKHFLTHHLALIKQAAPLLWGVSFEEEKKEVVHVGFVVESKVDSHMFGRKSNYALTGALVKASDFFNLPSEANEFVKFHEKHAKSSYLTVKKLTIYTDGTHLLEDVKDGADEEQ